MPAAKQVVWDRQYDQEVGNEDIKVSHKGRGGEREEDRLYPRYTRQALSCAQILILTLTLTLTTTTKTKTTRDHQQDVIDTLSSMDQHERYLLNLKVDALQHHVEDTNSNAKVAMADLKAKVIALASQLDRLGAPSSAPVSKAAAALSVEEEEDPASGEGF